MVELCGQIFPLKTQIIYVFTIKPQLGYEIFFDAQKVLKRVISIIQKFVLLLKKLKSQFVNYYKYDLENKFDGSINHFEISGSAKEQKPLYTSEKHKKPLYTASFET